jgi:hypothetical protein
MAVPAGPPLRLLVPAFGEGDPVKMSLPTGFIDRPIRTVSLESVHLPRGKKLNALNVQLVRFQESVNRYSPVLVERIFLDQPARQRIAVCVEAKDLALFRQQGVTAFGAHRHQQTPSTVFSSQLAEIGLWVCRAGDVHQSASNNLPLLFSSRKETNNTE